MVSNFPRHSNLKTTPPVIDFLFSRAIGGFKQRILNYLRKEGVEIHIMQKGITFLEWQGSPVCLCHYWLSKNRFFGPSYEDDFSFFLTIDS
jgi:hypothetical protein